MRSGRLVCTRKEAAADESGELPVAGVSGIRDQSQTGVRSVDEDQKSWGA